jgi:3-hydroxyacyl-CoA dehydrogenase
MTNTALRLPVLAETHGDLGVISIDNPPVNALSFAVAQGLLDEIARFDADPAIRGIIITGRNGLFSGGADINEFLSPPPPEAKNIRDAIAAIEKSDKTFIAAIDGNALGGGCELSLACDYRIGSAKAKIGLPEIKLGLIPGAGGTQRLPRLIGAQAATQFMLKGDAVNAEEAKKLGILDEVVEGSALKAAIEHAPALMAKARKRRVSAMAASAGAGMQLFALPMMVAAAHKMVPPEDKGGFAAHKLIDAVEASTELDLAHGLAREFRYFDELVRSDQARAYMHIFFAERELGKIPGLGGAKPRTIEKAAIIGAGTMGTGIAIVFANAGIPVKVLETDQAQVDRAKQMIMMSYGGQVMKGKLTQEEAMKRGSLITVAGDYAELADADVVVEAVFENMDVKKQIFAKLDAVLKPGAIIASNTSTLDIDEMASVTKRPQNVVGLHFFAPAFVMKLLEVVRGKDSSPETIATAMALAKKLRKVGVLSGNAFGFIGNRMLFDYAREAVYLAEEGSTPAEVDRAMREFGMAMGPFGTFDLSGVDVFWRIDQEHPQTVGRKSTIVDRLYEMKRFGQKTGAGFYKYEEGKRDAIPDPEIEALIASEAQKAGIQRRAVSDGEIVTRCVYALINVGANLLHDKVALRPGDIDIVWIYGYGFPPFRGGPMQYADSVGIRNVYETIKGFEQRFGEVWKPSPLLEQLAASGRTFAQLEKETVPA